MGLDSRVDDPFDFRAEPAMAFIRTAQVIDQTRGLAGAVYRVMSGRTVRANRPRRFAAHSTRAVVDPTPCNASRIIVSRR